jgi:DNA primase
MWHRADPASGTVVEIYHNSRGIQIDMPITIRSARFIHAPTGQNFPAMVCAVQQPDGKIAGIHRTFLREDGAGKASLPAPKMSLGKIKGGAVRLAKVEAELIVAEGVETALSVMQATGKPTWAGQNTLLSARRKGGSNCIEATQRKRLANHRFGGWSIPSMPGLTRPDPSAVARPSGSP